MGGMNDKGYRDWIGGIARRYRQSQIKAATAVNVEMLKFYWSLGADIVRLEKDQPWGSKFMNRISADLKAWMPEAKCFSRVNLYYMVRFFNLYAPAQIVQQIAEQPADVSDESPIVQQVAEQLPLRAFITEFPNVCQMVFSVPWGHHMVLMDKFGEDQGTALFHVRKTVENGWSRAMLENNADFKSQMPTIEEVEGALTQRMEIAEVRKASK